MASLKQTVNALKKLYAKRADIDKKIQEKEGQLISAMEKAPIKKGRGRPRALNKNDVKIKNSKRPGRPKKSIKSRKLDKDQYHAYVSPPLI